MEKIKEGESQKREDAGPRKGRKVAIRCFFPMICGSGGPKSNLAKAAGAEPAGQMKDEKLHATCGAKHISKSNVYKAHHGLGPLLEVADVGKVHALVARSTFPSQNVQNTPFSDHFWKFRCRKSARPCGTKHISKSKGTKHTMPGLLFGSRDVEKVHADVARSTCPSQNAQNTSV